MKRIHLSEINSTNTYLKELLTQGVELPGETLVDAEFQTGGRGQRGNSWESKPGENLTFSILCHPDFIRADHQFLISQAIALAIWNTLDDLIEGVTIKWPNDIYWNDSKICGILIECDLKGANIGNCIIGVGLNINQQKFESDAPNPVSLAQIVGFTFDKEKILTSIIEHFEKYYSMLQNGQEEQLVALYKDKMYRKQGLYKYAETDGYEFLAEIVDVEPQGMLVLRHENGEEKKYEFKQIKWILNT